MDWMLADNEPPMPAAGSVLKGVGLRVQADVALADPQSPDSIVQLGSGAPHEVTYRLTGQSGQARDFYVNAGPAGEHGGAEFLLTVETGRYQVQTGVMARDLPVAGRVAVMGKLSVVGEYEWDNFELEDARADWFVKAVVPLDGGDVMVDLVLTPEV
jgi:hypothetical protein